MSLPPLVGRLTNAAAGLIVRPLPPAQDGSLGVGVEGPAPSQSAGLFWRQISKMSSLLVTRACFGVREFWCFADDQIYRAPGVSPAFERPQIEAPRLAYRGAFSWLFFAIIQQRRRFLWPAWSNASDEVASKYNRRRSAAGQELRSQCSPDRVFSSCCGIDLIVEDDDQVRVLVRSDKLAK